MRCKSPELCIKGVGPLVKFISKHWEWGEHFCPGSKTAFKLVVTIRQQPSPSLGALIAGTRWSMTMGPDTRDKLGNSGEPFLKLVMVLVIWLDLTSSEDVVLVFWLQWQIREAVVTAGHFQQLMLWPIQGTYKLVDGRLDLLSAQYTNRCATNKHGYGCCGDTPVRALEHYRVTGVAIQMFVCRLMN